MIRRLILLAVLAALPAVALADSSVQLGPATNSAQSTSGSTSTGTILQPNDSDQLQSNGTSSTELTAPDTSSLQQTPQNSSNLQALVESEADQGAHTLPTQPPTTVILAWFLSIVLIGMLAWHYGHTWWLRQKHVIPD